MADFAVYPRLVFSMLSLRVAGEIELSYCNDDSEARTDGKMWGSMWLGLFVLTGDTLKSPRSV